MANSDSGNSRLTFIQRTRRAQLVECAIDVLAEDGYAQASLSRIARRADVSRGVIPYHFADRDELIEAVVSEVYALATAELRPRIDAEETAAGAIRAFILGSAEFYREYPKHIAALREISTHSRSEDGTVRHSGQRAAHEQELSAVGVLLAQGQRDGEFRHFSAPVMARTIRAALDGLLLDMRANPNLDAMADAEELASLFERAMASETVAEAGTLRRNPVE